MLLQTPQLRIKVRLLPPQTGKWNKTEQLLSSAGIEPTTPRFSVFMCASIEMT
jgi:hypothetical protein